MAPGGKQRSVYPSVRSTLKIVHLAESGTALTDAMRRRRI
jgi:hypothetical protein